jgi:hypothetical protein
MRAYLFIPVEHMGEIGRTPHQIAIHHKLYPFGITLYAEPNSETIAKIRNLALTLEELAQDLEMEAAHQEETPE